MTDAASKPNFAAKPPAGSGYMLTGTVAKLNIDAGFGYVSDSDGVHSYIFVFGHALRRTDGANLRIGTRVQYKISGQGRVDELVAV